MGHAQRAPSAPWEGQGEVLGPSCKAMTMQGWGPHKGKDTFFWPALLCHPRAGLPIIIHITNPAPSVPIAVLGPARSLRRKEAFPPHSNLPIHHPWLQAWAGRSLPPPCRTQDAPHSLAGILPSPQPHWCRSSTEAGKLNKSWCAELWRSWQARSTGHVGVILEMPTCSVLITCPNALPWQHPNNQ